MRKVALAAMIGLAVGLPWFVNAQYALPHSYIPPNGFVPDSLTAVRIATAVWSPIYGEQQIKGQQPYRASLRDSIWTVEGSLPDGMRGGVASAEISKRDGRIIRVSHDR
jgi:hypothetical protein